MDQTVIIVLVNTPDPLAYLNFNFIFHFFGEFSVRHSITFQKGTGNVDMIIWSTRHANFVGRAV